MNKKLKIGIGIAVLVVALIGIFFAVRGCSKDETYIVTFNSNGGTNVSSQTISEGSVVKEPSNPIRDGYTFGGWYINLEKDEKYDFGQKVTKNFTLIAKWNKNEEARNYSITFSGDGITSKIQTVNSGEKLTKPVDPIREGYKFLGWYNGNALFDFNSSISADLVLTAKWEKEVTNEQTSSGTVTKPKPKPEPKPEVRNFTVSFNSDGGSVVADKTVKENETITLTNPIKNGYKFLGWFDGSSKVQGNYKVTKNVTLVAKWEKIEDKYTISFKQHSEQVTIGTATVMKNGIVVSYTSLLNANGKPVCTGTSECSNITAKDFKTITQAIVDGKTVNITK